MNNEMKLLYKRPAECWEESLPIGNGSLGAMVTGKTGKEVLGLNEESLWSGYYKDKNNQEAFESLEKVRELIFAGRNKEAERLVEKKMLGEYNESYLPLGNLELRFEEDGQPVRDYSRCLDIERAVASVSYVQGNVRFEREYFASYPARAILVKLCADRPALEAEMTFVSQLECETQARPEGLFIRGKCPEHVDPSYIPDRENAVIQGTRGMEFKAQVRILGCDGKVTQAGSGIRISGASECVLLISAVREPVFPDGEEKWKLEDGSCDSAIALYDKLKKEHIADYRRLYERVELYLGDQPDIPTQERLENLRRGERDNGLYSLYFQYGRYLLIASSRPGSLPANLQGIWNWEMRAPWSSNWTVNINTQMNYWPALSCRLPECVEPYSDMMKKVCAEGKKTAAVNYHCRGFVAHHNLDYWGNTNPVGLLPGVKEGDCGSAAWAFWPMGGAWLAQELYRVWEYGRDRAYLEETAFPVIREAALFLNDWLVEHDGVWMTCPSNSPENNFYLPDGAACCFTCASTMDMTIVREVFREYEALCAELGREDELLADIREKSRRLAPFCTGSFGQLLEWHEEYGEPEPGHRHVSHLYGLFPSELFSGDDRLTQACRVSLEHRLKNGGGHTGWSCAWIINLFAVLKDGEKAFEYLRTLLCRSSYPNLWDAHPPFQIDGNFGGTAGIANMLVQDRGGEVSILPALPSQFRDGWVKGLAVKGRKAVDIEWKDGKEVSHRIYDI